MFRLLATGLLVCAVTASTAMAAPQFFPAESGRPFSAAVRVGHTVYASGAIGTAPDGSLPADFTAQATNAMQNVAAEFKEAGASMDDVYRCGVSLADMKDYAAFNAVYVKFFKPGHLPVRAAIGANGLAKGAAVEVECEAYTGKQFVAR